MSLAIENLGVVIARGDDGRGPELVSELSVAVAAGRTLALVGESGSGKTVTALAAADLLPPALERVSGRIVVGDRPMETPADWTEVRGRDLAFVFQEPRASLDPSFSVGHQLVAAIRAHRSVSRSAARREAFAWLERVGIDLPAERAADYPHQLSGGQLQRITIAMALVHRPACLIADEPTSSLDVVKQGEILGLLQRLQAETGMAMLLITHDLRVVRAIADDVAVLYAGRLAERLPAAGLDSASRHPYSRALVAISSRDGRAATLPGGLPPPGGRPTGCAFRDRCDQAEDGCAAERPRMVRIGADHELACPPQAGDMAPEENHP